MGHARKPTHLLVALLCAGGAACSRGEAPWLSGEPLALPPLPPGPVMPGWEGGAGVGDFDGDGRADLALALGASGLHVLLAGPGGFTPADERLRVPALQANALLVADLDGDGRDDLIAGGAAQLVVLAGGAGEDGGFLDRTGEAALIPPAATSSLTAFDADADGDLDLVIGDHGPGQFLGGRTRLYENLGGWRFRDASDAAALDGGRATLTPIAVDADDDGDLDLLLVNDMGMYFGGHELYLNPGDLTRPWREAAAELGIDQRIFGMGVAAGDIDGDGREDLYIGNLGDNPTMLARPGGFQRVLSGAGCAVTEDGGRGGDPVALVADFAQQNAAMRDFYPAYLPPGGGWALTSWGVALADFDGDGWLDAQAVNGHIGEPWMPEAVRQPDCLQRSDGAGGFELRPRVDASESAGSGRGLAVADLDEDGALDAVTVEWQAGLAVVRVWHGRGHGHAWLRVQLRGAGANSQGVGALVTLEHGGRRQLRRVRADGYLSTSERVAHFGLGDGSVAAADLAVATVTWPSGRRERFEGLRPGALHLLAEGSGAAEVAP